MTRRRSKANEKLPPYVYKAKGRYILRRYDPETRKQTETRLCAGDATITQVWQAYEAQCNATETATKQTFEWLSLKYRKSAKFKKLGPRTQQEYEYTSARICAVKLRDGRTLGAILLTEWTPVVVQKWQDKREETAPVAANREKSYMSRVFNWGLARGYCSSNPASDVARLPEASRTRYVTDDEYAAVLTLAAESGSPYLVPLMEFAYLCNARTCEILDLERKNVEDDGLLLVRRKGSKDTFFLWTPRLRAAVNAAKALQDETVKSRWLFAGSRDHGRMRESTVQTAYQRLMQRYIELGGKRFTFHDLKAKGVTDTEENKLAASGHRDPKMLAVYDRLPSRVKATR